MSKKAIGLGLIFVSLISQTPASGGVGPSSYAYAVDALVSKWLREPEGQVAVKRALESLDARLKAAAPLLFESPPDFDGSAAVCVGARPNEPQVYSIIIAPEYNHPALRQVIGPANDAKLLIATLERRSIRQENIHSLTQQVDRSRVVDAMEKIVPCLKRHDQVVFYFSGHAEWFNDARYSALFQDHLERPIWELAETLCSTRAQELASEPGEKPEVERGCAESVKTELSERLLRLHLEGAARESLGTILSFSDGPFGDQPGRDRLKLAGMRARDVSAFVTAARNRGADAFIVIDTHHAGGLEIGARQARAEERWTALTEPGSGRLIQAENGGGKLNLNPGGFAGFYVSGAAGNAWEMKPEGQELTYGPLTYAMAQALQSEQRPTVRQLAESISRRIVQKDLLGQIEEAALHSDVLPSYEATDPDLAFLAPERPLSTGEDAIEILQPRQMRGAVRIAAPTLEIVGRIKDRRRDDIVMVEVDRKNVLATLDQNLEFRSTVQVAPGKTQVEVSVLTRDGIFLRRDLAFSLEGGLEALLGEGHRYALIIGNKNYDRSNGYESLVTPHADARKVAEVLMRRHGFTTKLPLADGRTKDLFLLDANIRDIDDALRQLRRRLTETDTLVIYYAGHGVYDDNFGSAWVPIDAEQDLPTSRYDGRYLQGHIKSMAARKVLVLSDSCYAGRLLRKSESADTSGGDGHQALLKAMGKKSRVFIAAGGNEPVLDGGGSGHSVFTRALVEGLDQMADAGPYFSARELFEKHIYPRVYGEEHQEPRYAPLDDSGHVGGDFIFARQ